MEGIILRTSDLEPNVLVSPHSLPMFLACAFAHVEIIVADESEPLRGFLFSSY
jgi:hypothetical protein